ncbi:hypothetical protein [Methanopyrus kandleri]
MITLNRAFSGFHPRRDGIDRGVEPRRWSDDGDGDDDGWDEEWDIYSCGFGGIFDGISDGITGSVEGEGGATAETVATDARWTGSTISGQPIGSIT